MSELLKYLEQVGRSVTGTEAPSRPTFEPVVAQPAPVEQETPEQAVQRIQTGIQDTPSLVTKRSAGEAAIDIGSGVASGVYGTVVGGTSLFLNPEQINAMRAPQKWLDSLKSDQAKVQAEAYNRETEQFNKTIEAAVMDGRISSFDGQVAIAKNSFSSMNAATTERAMAEGAGSVAFLIGMSAFGAPGAIAGWTAMGATTLAAPVDGVLRELYAEVAPGQFKYTHEDLIDSSPVYQQAYEKTGSEEKARQAVFNEGRKISVLTPENIGGTLIQLAGERLLLKMSGTLKSAREIGGITAIPRNVGIATVGETAAEVSGDTLSTMAANKGIQKTFNEDRDYLQGTGAGVPQAAMC